MVYKRKLVYILLWFMRGQERGVCVAGLRSEFIRTARFQLWNEKKHRMMKSYIIFTENFPPAINRDKCTWKMTYMRPSVIRGSSTWGLFKITDCSHSYNSVKKPQLGIYVVCFDYILFPIETLYIKREFAVLLSEASVVKVTLDKQKEVWCFVPPSMCLF